jgi:S-adenosylmethionine:tRNA ribosyltransferase-isomerase
VKTSQFSFDLPSELIAQEPSEDRSAARLLVLNRADGSVRHLLVSDIAGLVESGTVLVLNDTRVRKARVFGTRTGGGKVELIFLRQVEPTLWEVLAGRSRKARPGTRIELPGGVSGTISEGQGNGAGEQEARLLRLDGPIAESWLEEHGHVPLPPYIKRADTSADSERYQTVYARVPGSAAAPTAGLHFTPGLLHDLSERGVSIAWVTLHVGLGTFLPIRTENIEDHAMHEEHYSVPRQTKETVDQAVKDRRPVMAVGTTVVRTLESAWTPAGLQEGENRTRLFISPGYRFNVVSRLMTNFHTPGSSLLVLVSAFAGVDLIRNAYAEAIRERYRFYSYGDAMLIL